MQQTKPPKTEAEFLQRARDLFKRASDHESESRALRREDLLFVRLGGEHQWPAYARKDREMQGRPMLTDNRTRQFRTAVVNNIRQNTPSVKVRPVSDDADKKTADVLAGLVRHIEQTTGGDIAKDKAVEFAVDTGLGYFGLMTRYVSDDAWDQEVAFRTIPDPFKVYWDTSSIMPDGSDAKWAFIIEDVPREDYEKLYPDDSGEWNEQGDGDGVWDTEETRRVAEYFCIEEQQESLLLLSDNRAVWESEYEQNGSAQVVQQRKAARRKCQWYKLSSSKILEKTELPTQYIPIFPVYGDEFWFEGRRHVEGLVRAAKGPQQLFNFWLSAVAEQIALQPKIPYIIPEGSEEADPNWATANSANHPYLKYRWRADDGSEIPGAPSRQPPPPIPTGYTEQMDVALEGIKAAVGMQNPAVGAEESANQSGKAIARLQAQAMVGTSHFSDNLAKSVAHCGRVLIEMAPRVYETKRVLRILGEDGEPEHFTHDPQAPQAYSETKDWNGAIQRTHNIGVGKYDVAVTVGPSYASKRDEGFQTFVEMAQAAPQIMQAAGDLVMRMSDSPYADQIADRLKATIPPQITQATETEDGEAPDPKLIQAQQQIQQFQALIQQMDSAIQGMTKDLEEAKSDKDIKRGELMLKAKELELKQQESQARLQNEAMAAQKSQEHVTNEPDELEIAKLQIQQEQQHFQQEMALLEKLMAMEQAEHAHETGEREFQAKYAAPKAKEEETGNAIASLQQLVTQLSEAVANLDKKTESRIPVGIAPKRLNGKLVGGTITHADGTTREITLQ